MQCVGGYFIRAVNLPRFWYYWAHFIDFQVSLPLALLYFEVVAQRKTKCKLIRISLKLQTYAFDLLVVNDFRGLTFDCSTASDGSCVCGYPSSLIAKGECKIAGDDVLNVRFRIRFPSSPRFLTFLC